MIRLRRSRRGQRSTGLNTGMHTSVGKQPAPCMLAPLHAGSFSSRVSAEDVARTVAKAGLKAVSATHEPNLNVQRRTGGRLPTLLPFPEPSWSPAVQPQSRRGPQARKLPRLARRLARHWPAFNEKHIRSDQPTNDKRRHCVSRRGQFARRERGRARYEWRSGHPRRAASNLN
jgi:hypothetical protein